MTRETIFDLKPTESELIELFGSPLSREQYDASPSSPDGDNADLYRLSMLRGDSAKANMYLSKIRDKQFRFDTQLIDLLQN